MLKVCDKKIKPFNAQEDTGVRYHWNFNSVLRRDHQKKFL